MTSSSIKELFQQFQQTKVLVVGDVMLDSYLWGASNRISPEAPVPIVSVEKREKRLGGAANVALNLSALGATPLLCTVVGDDQESQEYFQLLEKRGLSAKGSVVSSHRKTTVKHRIIASAQHLLRVDSEDTFDLVAEELKLLEERFELLLDEADVVLFQDYNKGVLTADNIAVFIEKAKAKNVPTIVDPKKKNFLAYKGVDVFKPNLKELGEGLNVDIDKNFEESLVNAVTLLKDELSMKNAFVTLSEKGVYIGDGEENSFSPAFDRKILDVSGAGDTVVSVASLCLAAGTTPQFLSQISNLSGGLVCEHVGVVPIDKDKLMNEAISNLAQ